MPSRQSQRVTVCGLRGAVVRDVGFKAKGRGFKSTHGCSHTVQKPSISPALFGQCTLNICLPFTIFTITIKIEFASNLRRVYFFPRVDNQKLYQIAFVPISALIGLSDYSIQ